MLSVQILQNTIDGLKAIMQNDITVAERDGKVAVSTADDFSFVNPHIVSTFINSPAENQTVSGSQYFKVYDNGIAEYALIIAGEGGDTYVLGKMAAFQISNLIVAYKERYDRDNFFKNLLFDNLLLVDIYSRAKKLHVDNNVRRVVYLIETEIDMDMNAVEVVRGLFPIKQRDFITALDEKCIILVKELFDKEEPEDIIKYAYTICDTLGGEIMAQAIVSIGNEVHDLKFVSSSYKEARMALDVGKLFEEGKHVIHYAQLGIGRLIYQLPPQLCRMFISEVLRGVTLDQIDDETLTTISKYFENDLNVSETSRELYIHRNTLMYRLEKLMKMTGLDLRKFEDAITFKIALMVDKYMTHKERHMF